jgi:hypothetical protein
VKINEVLKISEVIARLQAILDAHGDLPVAHHDDWANFYVDSVEYEEAYGEGTAYTEPAHALITGNIIEVGDTADEVRRRDLGREASTC